MVMEYYYAIITKSRQQNFIAEFPDIPEAFTQAESLLECYEMAEDVLAVCIEAYIRERRTMPAPSSYEEINAKLQEIVAEDKELLDLSFTPVIQFFKVPDVSQKPVKIAVSFPKYALDTIDMKADKLGMTRSGFLVKAALAYH